MIKPHITVKGAVYTCEGDGIKRTGRDAITAHERWQQAFDCRAKKAKEAAREAHKAEMGKLPIVPSRTPRPFKQLEPATGIWLERLQRASQAQPPIPGMNSTARGIVDKRL